MHDPFFWPDKYVQRLKEMYAPDRGFGLVAGRLEGKLVGYAFGRSRGNTAGIWQAVKEKLPDIEAPASPEPIFILCEFQVHPDHPAPGRIAEAARGGWRAGPAARPATPGQTSPRSVMSGGASSVFTRK
jgi:hypothetical protein